jgi:hypothetical protein
MKKKRKKKVRAGCCRAGRSLIHAARVGALRCCCWLRPAGLAAAGWAGFGPVRSAADPLFFSFFFFEFN